VVSPVTASATSARWTPWRGLGIRAVRLVEVGLDGGDVLAVGGGGHLVVERVSAEVEQQRNTLGGGDRGRRLW
jgi:hypothetical protein